MLNEQLKFFRCSKEMTQEEVAKKIGVTQQGYGHWEKGDTEPSLENLKKLSQFFGVSADELLGNTVTKADESNSILNKAFAFQPEILYWMKQPQFTLQGHGVVKDLSDEYKDLIVSVFRHAFKAAARDNKNGLLLRSYKGGKD